MKKFFMFLLAAMLIVGCSKKEEENVSQESETGEIKITEGAVKEQKTQKKSLDKGKFYYSYNKAKKEDEEAEESYTQLDAYRRVKNRYQMVKISLLVNKLSKKFLVYCSACHDDYANGIIGPSLLGRSEEYIYDRLIAFKDGRRKNVLMVQLVGMLSNKELKALADEIAEFNEKVEKIKRGEKID
jgi:cytochrome c553